MSNYQRGGNNDDWASSLAVVVGRVVIGLVIGALVALVAWSIGVAMKNMEEPLVVGASAGVLSIVVVGMVLLALGIGGGLAIIAAAAAIVMFIMVMVFVAAFSDDGDQEGRGEDLHSILGRWE